MERIISIKEFEDLKADPRDWGGDDGFKIVTDEQEILLCISNGQSCCENWGYFLSEQDTEKFVGAELRGVSITDTNRTSRKFLTGYDDEYNEGDVHLDEGDVMFVDLETDRGVLQFVAYNAHNGYYGHTARIESRQLTHLTQL